MGCRGNDVVPGSFYFTLLESWATVADVFHFAGERSTVLPSHSNPPSNYGHEVILEISISSKASGRMLLHKWPHQGEQQNSLADPSQSNELREIINYYCFFATNFGVVYYAVVDNWETNKRMKEWRSKWLAGTKTSKNASRLYYLDYWVCYQKVVLPFPSTSFCAALHLWLPMGTKVLWKGSSFLCVFRPQ